jgi:hypothetical protein
MTLGLRYRSPSTCLDLRLYPAIGIDLASWIILFAFGFLWAFLLWMHWSERRRMHVSIARLIAFAAVRRLFRFIELEVENVSDVTGWAITDGILQVLNYTSFLYIFLLTVHGLSTISEELKSPVIYDGLSRSIVTVLALTNLLEWDQFTLLWQVLLALVGLVLYGSALIGKIQAALLQITLMIMTEEVRAPAVEMRYTLAVRVVFGTGVFLAGFVVLAAIVELDEWVAEMLISACEIGVIGGFMAVFWMRKSDRVGLDDDLIDADIDELPAIAKANEARPLLES